MEEKNLSQTGEQKKSLTDSDIFKLICKTLGLMDKKTMKHSCKTAYIYAKLLRHTKKYNNTQIAQYTAIAMLHDLGEYKLQNDSVKNQNKRLSAWSHSIYSYLYIKNFSPLGEMGNVVLYHHVHMRKFDENKIPNCTEAVLLGFADRIAHALEEYESKEALKNMFVKYSNRDIYPEVVFQSMQVCVSAVSEYNIPVVVLDGSYEEELYKILDTLNSSEEDKRKFLELLMYAFDFQTDEAFLETLRTICIAEQIGDVMLVSEEDRKNLSEGALLYNIGKFAMPVEILRKPGKLTETEMTIVRSHVSFTEYLLGDFFPQAVVNVAARHHERLDGTGYPRGLKGGELTLPERILAVAEVVSSLSSDKMYRKALPREKIFQTVFTYMKTNKLCPYVGKVLLKQYDMIMDAATENAQKASKAFVIGTALQFNELYARLNQFKI